MEDLNKADKYDQQRHTEKLELTEFKSFSSKTPLREKREAQKEETMYLTIHIPDKILIKELPQITKNKKTSREPIFLTHGKRDLCTYVTHQQKMFFKKLEEDFQISKGLVS